MAAKRIALAAATFLALASSSPNVSTVNVSIASMPAVDVGLLHKPAGVGVKQSAKVKQPAQKPEAAGILSLHSHDASDVHPEGDAEEAIEQAIASLKGTKPTNFLRKADRSSSNGSSSQSPDMPTSISAKELSTAESMEAAITELMLGKTAFGATPMGGSVQMIQNLIMNTMIPNVKSAHSADQRLLDRLSKEVEKCGSNKKSAFGGATTQFATYKANSRLHKRCRSDEAVRFSSKQSCAVDQESRFKIKVLKCKAFAHVSRQLGTTKNNAAIINKGGSESVESYVRRLSSTFCGKHVHGNRGTVVKGGGWGGGLMDGFLDKYLKSKEDCHRATKAYHEKVKECKKKTHAYNVRKAQCNQYQGIMDTASCKRAVLVKDACESYAGCYSARRKAFRIAESKVRFNERDRKAEWRGLKRMECLISGFADGKMQGQEVDECKAKTHNTDHLIIKYPEVPGLVKCAIPTLYPSTGAYKRAEFAPLPALAKGKESPECTGVQEIGTTPHKLSPKSCTCTRVTLNGFYSPGPLVKCEKCLDVSRSTQTNSCPRGTKLFAPASRQDWKTFLNSAGPLRNPNWIIDVTSPLNNCGGCTSNAMNSGNKKQSAWRTSDGSPWWLRSTKASQPSGDYLANCYMDILRKPISENSITFNDNRCNVHSKSYYCQPEKIHLKPRSGSPNSCKCSQVDLAGSYSPGALIKCEQCISVSKANQKNSCPAGMKIFSPRSRGDWRTFLKSAGPLRAPNWIIDVTRPSSGCGGCTRYAMKFSQPQQRTWRTTDGSGWWLRDRKYTHPNGDYSANCFMDLFKTPTSENTIAFDDDKCNVRSRSYYCQPIQKKKKDTKPPPAPTERRLVAWSSLKQGIVEKVFYFKQGAKCPDLNHRNPNMMRRINKIDYPETKDKFPGFVRSVDFAVRWDFFLIVKIPGTYTFYVTSADGSKLLIDGKSVVNNDGRHPMRTAYGKVKLVKGQHFVFATMFQGEGSSAMKLIYKGPDTEDRNLYVGSSAMYVPPKGFKEEVYYIKDMKSVPNLDRVAAMERISPHVVYKETKSAWPGFRQASDVAVRWTGTLKIKTDGRYRWSLLSDDGSLLFLQNEGSEDWVKVVDNDGKHSLKNKESNYRASGMMKVKLEYFNFDGSSCMIFRYMGSDTDNKMKFVPQAVMMANV